MKITVLGPDSAHYKGGIAQFTTRLCDELSRSATVSHVSWKRMYPPFLSKREFRDNISKTKPGNTSSENLLDYINPISWSRFIRSTTKSTPDKIVVTWIHPVHAPLYLLFFVCFRLFSRAELTLLCHNVFPHEKVPLQRMLTWPIFKLAHSIIVHGQSESKLAESLVPAEKISVLFHPLFDVHDAETPARTFIQDTPLKLLFFGAIRPYKGLDVLLEVVARMLNAGVHIELTIAGEPFEGQKGAIEKQIGRLGLAGKASTRLEYIANEEIADLFANAHVSIYPYRSATQSGSLAMSYAFGVPVIATNVGGLADVVEDGVSGYLVAPSVAGIEEGIRKFIQTPIDPAGVSHFAQTNLSWSRYASEITRD